MVIKVEKLNEDQKNNRLSLLIKGTDEVFANSIRRMVLEEVPTLAVEEVEIKENGSALYDEMLALRLGLIPIKTDLSSYSLPKNKEEIKERSARCTLQIKLKSAKKGYVYAEEAESADPNCTFVNPKMPIVKLLQKQKIDLLMIAVMGQGKEHAKWAPGFAYYKHEPVIKLGKVEKPELVARYSSDGVFTLNGNKLVVNENKVYESNLLTYYPQLDSGITVEYTKNILFYLESWGQLSCKEILEVSTELFGNKIKEMENLL